MFLFYLKGLTLKTLEFIFWVIFSVLLSLSFLQANNSQEKYFVSYLWRWWKIYKKMQPNRKQEFEKIYNQIIKDNWKTITMEWEQISTTETIHSCMRNLCYFLYNLDAKRTNMVSFHKKLINQIEKWQSMWLIVNNDIKHTLYWFKILSEMVDKERDWWENTPSNRQKEVEEIKKELQNS